MSDKAATFLDREEERATVNREHVFTFDWCQAVTFNKTDGGRRSALTGAPRSPGASNTLNSHMSSLSTFCSALMLRCRGKTAQHATNSSFLHTAHVKIHVNPAYDVLHVEGQLGTSTESRLIMEGNRSDKGQK